MRRSYSVGAYGDYMRMARDSSGFDVTPMGRRLCGGISPMEREGSLKDAARVANIAINQYNQTNNENLVFDSLVKANGQAVGGFIYYLTFRVRCPPDDQLMVYQAKVFVNVSKTYFNDIFRPHPRLSIRYPGKTARQYKKAAKDWTRSRQQKMEAKAGPSSRRPKKARKKEANPLSLPKGSFFSFVSDLRKVPEIANMDNYDVIDIASIKWNSMSAAEKRKHCTTRSLKYEDIVGSISEFMSADVNEG